MIRAADLLTGNCGLADRKCSFTADEGPSITGTEGRREKRERDGEREEGAEPSTWLGHNP